MNIAIGQRIVQLRVNLQRTRWESPQRAAHLRQGQRAQCDRPLRLRQRGRVAVPRRRVAPTHAHALFPSHAAVYRAETDVDGPAKNVREVLAEFRCDLGYLQRMAMGVIDRSGRPVAVTAAELRRYSVVSFQYAFRQGPLAPRTRSAGSSSSFPTSICITPLAPPPRARTADLQPRLYRSAGPRARGVASRRSGTLKLPRAAPGDRERPQPCGSAHDATSGPDRLLDPGHRRARRATLLPRRIQNGRGGAGGAGGDATNRAADRATFPTPDQASPDGGRSRAGPLFGWRLASGEGEATLEGAPVTRDTSEKAAIEATMRIPRNIFVARALGVAAVATVSAFVWVGWWVLAISTGLAVAAGLIAPRERRVPRQSAYRRYRWAVERRLYPHAWRPGIRR
jgi:hypothetical protein